ncbi:MAG: NADH-quinone oxidoreductase subunit NuoH [Planctomycetes bacterium]|nr:NADH-quinone oxidoreductase subunit NuoH [Planctomycetota bacterium]
MTRVSTPWPPPSGWELSRPIRALGELLMLVYRVLGAIFAVTPLPRVTVAAALLIKRLATPILLRFPGMILISALVGGITGVWLIAVVFDVVDGAMIATPAAVVPGAEEGLVALGVGVTPPNAFELFAVGLEAEGIPAVGVLKFALFPFRYALFRDALIVFGIVFIFVGAIPFFAIWWERKVAGRIQSRLGPMRVGGWHGWAQSAADGIKLICKEDLVPAGADKPLFLIAPYLTVVPVVLAFVALPFGTYWVFRDLDVSLIFILAMMGIEVVGVIIAGWSSNNKWSVYGAMREACQMVSYEIPMGLALLIPVVCTGTLSLREIGDMQAGGFTHWLVFRNPFIFLGCLSYYIASLANCKRAPFDLPESESELVAGFHTEYSGYRWSLFFFAEYSSMFVVSALAVVLFLGAWHSPFPAWGGFAWGAGPVWFVAKSLALIYLQLWIRWTLPRIRIDQVLYSCIQVMLPLVMLLLLGNAFYELLVPEGGVIWTVWNLFLSAIGAGLVLGFVAIACYGRIHRKDLVGKLAIDHLPAA